MNNHPIPQDNIVLTWVEPKGGLVTAWPNQIAIIIRDGKVVDVFTEDTRSVRPGILSRSKVQAFIAYATPFSLTFRLEDEYRIFDGEDDIPLDGIVLTADGHSVTAQIGMTFSVDRLKADLLLRLSPTGRPVSKYDIGTAIKGELMAKVLALDIRNYTAEELRGNETLLRSLYQSLRRELDSTLSNYGLRLDNFYANWGLTTPEEDRLAEHEHQRHLRDLERQQELQRKAREEEEHRAEQRRLENAQAREEERAREDRLRLQEARIREEARVREEALLRLDERERARQEEDQRAQQEAERAQAEAKAQERMRYRLFFQGVEDKLMRLGVTENLVRDTEWTWIEFPSRDFSWVSCRSLLSPAVNEAWVSLIIDSRNPQDDMKLFDLLAQKKDSIEADLGELTWVRYTEEYPSQIVAKLPNCSINDEHPALERTQIWIADKLCAFKRVFELMLRWTDVDSLRCHRAPFYRRVNSKLQSLGVESTYDDEEEELVVPTSVSWAYYRAHLGGDTSGSPQATVTLRLNYEFCKPESLLRLMGLGQEEHRTGWHGLSPMVILEVPDSQQDIEVEANLGELRANLPYSRVSGRYSGLQDTENWVVNTLCAFKNTFDPPLREYPGVDGSQESGSTPNEASRDG